MKNVKVKSYKNNTKEKQQNAKIIYLYRNKLKYSQSKNNNITYTGLFFKHHPNFQEWFRIGNLTN